MKKFGEENAGPSVRARRLQRRRSKRTGTGLESGRGDLQPQARQHWPLWTRIAAGRKSPSPAPDPTPEPTPAPTPSPSPQPSPAPDPEPQPEPTPDPEPEEPAFDIERYVQYARDYALSVGLELDPDTMASWDTPMIFTAADAPYIEQSIRERIAISLREGDTAVWCWAEDLGGGRYAIYIGRG